MKSALLFIFFLFIGFTITFFLVNKKSSQEIVKPKVTISSEISKFSLERAPSTSLHGEITMLSGDVMWQSRIATEASAITLKQKIQQGESLETGKTGEVSVAFPNMLFEISTDTKLNVIQALPASIVLEQPTGKIKYQTTSSTPLGIRISPVLIESKKGNFTISIDGDDGTVTLYVENGLVTAAYNDSDNISTLQKITEDEVFTFDPSTRTSTTK